MYINLDTKINSRCHSIVHHLSQLRSSISDMNDIPLPRIDTYDTIELDNYEEVFIQRQQLKIDRKLKQIEFLANILLYRVAYITKENQESIIVKEDGSIIQGDKTYKNLIDFKKHLQQTVNQSVPCKSYKITSFLIKKDFERYVDEHAKELFPKVDISHFLWLPNFKD